MSDTQDIMDAVVAALGTARVYEVAIAVGTALANRFNSAQLSPVEGLAVAVSLFSAAINVSTLNASPEEADAMRQGSESARSQPRLTPEAASAYRANAARPQAAAEDMVRRGTGGQRRVEDLENMSEAELEAMVRKAGAQGAAKR